MSDVLDEAAIGTIRDFILANTGILFDDRHTHDLCRHIASACTDLKIPLETCVQQVNDSSFQVRFLEILVNYITIGETYFFRDKNLFLFLRDSLLPNLIRSRRQEHKLYLRIWSAACSSGEEPYSLAILLRYLLVDVDDWDIYLLATDINQQMLNRAQEGIYSRWSFRDDPLIPVGSFFSPTPDNRMKIDDSVRTMVRFERMNLIHDSSFYNALGPSSLDLILCRNVLMYFSPEQSGEVVSHLVTSLRTGGFLIVSPQEIGIVQGQFIRMHHHGSVFLHEKVDQNNLVAAEKISPSLSTTFYSDESVPVTRVIEGDLFHEPDIHDIPDFPGDIFLDEENKPGDSSGVVYLLEPDDEGFDRLISENRLEEAGKMISQSGYQSSPQWVRQMEILIRAYAGNGEYDKALGWSDRLIAADVLNPRPYLLKAAVLDEQGLYNDSLQSLRQSLYAFPDYLPAHLAIAGIYKKTGRPDLARHHYELAIHILDSKDEDIILEETEGIPARKMKDMIQMLLGG